jgi:hypothetical protein
MTRRPLGVLILARKPETLLLLRLVPSKVRLVIVVAPAKVEVAVNSHSLQIYHLEK